MPVLKFGFPKASTSPVPMPAKVREGWDDRGIEFDCWHHGGTWNGWHMPLMTAKQLDVYLKHQRLPTDDFIRADGKGGYELVLGVYGEIDPIEEAGKTPDGEVLFDVSINWCWQIGK